MDSPKRYHPLLVTLHWLVVVLVLLNLYVGLYVFLDRGLGFQGIDQFLPLHMAAGTAILALVIVRFFVRIGAQRPAEAGSGSAALDVVAKVVHYGLYVMLLATTVIGLTFALQSSRFQEAFLGAQPRFGRQGGAFPPPNGTPFPGFAQGQQPFARGTPGAGGFQGGPSGQGFQGFQGRRGGPGGFFGLMTVHLWAAYILLALVILHILAALYHQFIRRDGLIGRMWFGAG
jgi:cytochrome b561